MLARAGLRVPVTMLGVRSLARAALKLLCVFYTPWPPLGPVSVGYEQQCTRFRLHRRAIERDLCNCQCSVSRTVPCILLLVPATGIFATVCSMWTPTALCTASQSCSRHFAVASSPTLQLFGALRTLPCSLLLSLRLQNADQARLLHTSLQPSLLACHCEAASAPELPPESALTGPAAWGRVLPVKRGSTETRALRSVCTPSRGRASCHRMPPQSSHTAGPCTSIAALTLLFTSSRGAARRNGGCRRYGAAGGAFQP